MYTNTIYTIFGLVASASAHLVMTAPKGWEVNSSPLDKTGSDFPCKGVAYDSSVEANVLNKGDSQPLKLKGSAVHGGGSCQISLTTDLEPTKDSVWKVIKSWEGGCPVGDMDGNYPENANLEVPSDLNFEIPEDVPAGKYTLAWTWFNRIGNREMYMNCAPAEAVGDGGDESSFNALPDMFVANIGGDCGTEEGSDLKFPDPGQNVERLGSGTPKGPVGCGGSEGGSGAGGEAGGEAGGDYGSDDGSTAPPAESAAPETPGNEPVPGGAHISDGAGSQPTEAPEADAPAESSAPVAEPTPAPEAPEESAPEESAPVETEEPEESAPVETEEPADVPYTEVPANNSEQDGSGSGSGGSGGYAVGTECSGVGTWNCIGGNSFQRCGSGVWSAVMQLSAGTECTPGEGENLQMVRKRGATRFGAKFLL